MAKKYLNIYDQILKNSEWKGKCLVSTYKVKRKEKCPQVTYEGKCITISRACWEFHNGKIPKGIFICHTCDNPKCFLLEHLFLGTPLENMQDMINKKRDNNFGARKYSQIQILKAIEMRELGWSYESIAKKLKMKSSGVSAFLIRAKIKKGKAITESQAKVMTEKMKEKIVELLEKKVSHVKIYTSLKISESSLYTFLKSYRKKLLLN